MKFNIYDRFTLEIDRQDETWKAWRIGEGRKHPETNLVIPPDLPESDLVTFLDDIYHEMAGPTTMITRLD